MKLAHHIKIARIILDKLESEDKKNINRFLFYLGSIAPDLNCIYPAHRLYTTWDRMERKIESVSALQSNVVKSFQLGMITHYVCDYFCYSHSNEVIGIVHRVYEKNLYRFFELHKELFNNNDKSNIQVEWEEALNIIQNKLFKYTDTLTIESHASMVMKQIELLNREYMSKSKGIRRDKNWTMDLGQCKRDLEYSIFMSVNVLKIVIDPIKCISLSY